MLLILTDEQKQHLTLVNQVDATVAKEFCRIAAEFIQNGINTKKYQMAAQKLELDAKLIAQCVEAIMYLLSESSKMFLVETDFKDSLLSLDLDEDVFNTLVEFYENNKQDIRKILSKMELSLPQYKNLEWRFDVQLATRMLTYQTTPQVMLKLHLNKGPGENDVTVLQTDPVNLVHMTQVLEEALNEIKTAHCRRIARNIK
ncbi:COMM domain-containing protein 2-like [Clytia hemisphaerica]|uniref:COMM domain-containing protein n=1 Tax=Clytia hemisphaerica TaxID=252671 RepID=A0A7M6DNA1_9CNID|eukprot:TCONS_00009777-protein